MDRIYVFSHIHDIIVQNGVIYNDVGYLLRVFDYHKLNFYFDIFFYRFDEDRMDVCMGILDDKI